MSGLVYQGVSIPLAYQSLQKPGNSHTDERKHLLTQVWAYLPRLLFSRRRVYRSRLVCRWSNPSILIRLQYMAYA